jgi:hypothetical protein
MTRRLVAHIRSQWLGALALFLVIAGGVAYAASLPRNSVGSREIKNESVKGIDVKRNALGGQEIAEDSLTLPEGPTGPPGPRGATGPTGPMGDAGPSAYGRFHDAQVSLPGGAGIGGNPRAGNEDVLALDLPSGSYFVLAKGNFLAAGEQPVAQCLLYADGDLDRVTVPSSGPFAMSVVASASAPFTVHLACNFKSGPCTQMVGCALLQDLKINAVSVRDVSNSAG